MRKLSPSLTRWLARRARRLGLRRRKRERRVTRESSFDLRKRSARSVLSPLLSTDQRALCFSLLRGEHWTTEHDGTTERRVKVAGAHAMPSLFCFETNYTETARVILGIRERMNENLRDYCLAKRNTGRQRRRRGYYFDFATINHISPAAALVFAAEYDRARAFLDKWALKLYNLSAWRHPVVQGLEQLGFFDLLEFPVGSMNVDDDQLRITRFQQSTSVDQQRAHRNYGGREQNYGSASTLRSAG